MSFHQIEDITEDAIRVIAATADLTDAQKRDIIYSLFYYHDTYDTSYTRFRVKDILVTYRLLYAWPIEKHPFYKLRRSELDLLIQQDQHWIPWEDSRQKGEVYYDNGYFFFEAGSDFWKTIKNELPIEEQHEPKLCSFLDLFLEVLKVGVQQQDSNFVAPWYAFLVNGLLNFDLPEDTMLNASFEVWSTNDTLRSLREMAVTHQMLIKHKKHSYKGDQTLSLPSLSNALYGEENPDYKAKIRFLLDFKKTIEQIENTYKKEENAYQKELALRAAIAEQGVNYFSAIFEYFRNKLDDSWGSGIQKVTEDGDYTCTFISKIKEESKNEEAVYCTLILEFSYELKLLGLLLGFQNGEILKWQKQAAGALPEAQHFVNHLIADLKYEKKFESYTSIDAGLFPFNPNTPLKKQVEVFEKLWLNYQKFAPVLFTFFQESIYARVKGKSISKLLKQREDMLEKQHINFIANEMDYLLFLAQLMKASGENQKKDEAMALLKAEFDRGLGSAPLRKRIEQGMNFVEIGQGNFPAITTLLNYLIQ